MQLSWGDAFQVISYSGLDLADAADRAELDRRIAASARAVCDSLRLQLSHPVMNNRCENGAKRVAYSQVRTMQLGG